MADKRTRKPVRYNAPTEAQVDKFFAVLAATANVSKAAKAAKVSRSWVYEQKEADEAFAARWKEAEDVACDALEEEARRRALKGTIKPIYQQGKRVGQVREYSDTLMVILLKAHRPEKYKDRSSVEQSGEVTIRWAE